jgi:putative heme-binding domain-containing protein
MRLSLRFIAAGACVALLLAFSTTVRAQRDAKVPDPDPEIERKALQLAEGFEINLFAADPLLAKPIQMNFDAAGRLWVACSEVYPQIKPGQTATDKIIILEDTKGEGKADKTTIFAEGLLIPTGVEPGDGGAYVANSTELVFFSDPDEKGKARKSRVVLSGFGTEDTHHILHTLRWGPDGQLYMNQSTYIHSHIETPWGVRHLNGGGIWQYRPENARLEVFARGLINPWGHHFDKYGQSFATDGAGGEGINYIIPGGYYAWAIGDRKVFPGLNPGSPKYCGEEILSGRHLPEDWRGNIITNDFRGHRVCRFVLREDGAGYAAQQKADLVRTDHPAFRPIDVKMGPDGAIYIADWYNPIIQHGEVDFRDPRRDQTHGRIWRITAKKSPLVPRPKLVDASTADLLEALKAPEDWTRHFAKRMLKERGDKVLPELEAWVKKIDPAAPESEMLRLEALWVYQSLDKVEPALLKTVAHAHDHHIRAAAARVVGAWHDRLPNPLELLAPLSADDHPQVRLEALRALAQVPEQRSAELALAALDRPTDRFLEYGLYLTVRDLEPLWMPALREGKLDFGGNPNRLAYALQAVNARDGLVPLVNLLKSGKVPADREENVLAVLAAQGGPAELALVLDHILAKEGNNAGRQVRLLAALEQSTRQRNQKPAGDLARLGALLDADGESVKAAAARVAGLWKLEAMRPQLSKLSVAAETPAALRQASIDGLVALGGKESTEGLAALTAGSHPVPVRRMAVIALTALDVNLAAAKAPEVLAVSDAETATDVFTAILQRKTGAAALKAALADKKLPTDVAKIGIRTARATAQNVNELVEALTKSGDVKAIKRDLTPQEMAALLDEVAKKGSAARGEVVYRRKDQVCMKCHAIAGAGGQVGPDLTSIGASAQADYLVESILLPNKIIKEGFHSLVVSTKSGQVHTGIKLRETKTELVLRNAEDKEIVVPINDVDEKAQGGSLMPEGLADPLTHEEFVDLVRFLSELGKVGPYAVTPARVVRRWEVLEPTPAMYKRLGVDLPAVATNDPALTWVPAYSRVAGILPVEEVPTFKNGGNQYSAVRCQFDATTGGKVKLLFNSTVGLRVWLDGQVVEAKEQTLLDLSTGTHTLTILLERQSRKDDLRCELDDVAGSPARVRVVGGK